MKQFLQRWLCLQLRATSIITWTKSAHQPPVKQWPSSLSCGNNDRKGPDSVLFAVHTHTRGIQKISLSGRLWPECVWYYSQLNEGFTEATWIKRVAATMYLVLCNAVNRFAEWGFNVFLYTNRMNASWNMLCVAEPCLKWQVGHFDVRVTAPTGGF